jgi:hypothetical protein
MWTSYTDELKTLGTSECLITACNDIQKSEEKFHFHVLITVPRGCPEHWHLSVPHTPNSVHLLGPSAPRTPKCLLFFSPASMSNRLKFVSFHQTVLTVGQTPLFQHMPNHWNYSHLPKKNDVLGFKICPKKNDVLLNLACVHVDVGMQQSINT